MQILLRGRTACRKCNGSGKYQIDLGSDSGAKNVKAVDGVACPVCKGVGSFAGYREISKVKMAVLQGRREFERRQMVAGDVRVGQALVPAALESLLVSRQRALVMTGMPAPCAECQLTGRQKCVTCKGTGWVKCRYQGCVNGEIKVTHKSTSRRSTRVDAPTVSKCPECDGTGEVPCETCKGSSSVACKVCDGSGLASRCKLCTGTGLITCSKCKGSGEVKGGPCPECKGETVVLCKTCRGEGAVAR
jgi:DnaJ-class molecular chaperone